MGNEICDAVQKQAEYKRTTLTQVMSPGNQGDRVSYTPSPSPKNSQTNDQQKHRQGFSKIKYNGHLIWCKPSDVRYHKPQDGGSRIPLINGIVQVYNKENEQLVFEGQLKNSKFNGFGKLYKYGNLVYEGQFKNNLFDGWGITSEYTGEFRDGLYDGYGIYREFDTENNKIVNFYYQGYFQSGSYSGSGVLLKGIKLTLNQINKIHNDDGILEFLNDQIEHGMDIIKVHGAKQIYIGQFSNGFRHGFGRLFTEKMEFSGQFSHNLYHGLGTIYNNTKQGKIVVQTVFKMGKQFKS